MKKLLIIVAITIFYACDSNDENRSYNNYDFADGVDFTIYNTQGQDLLDPETPNHIKESEMKLFYLIKGVKKEVYNGFLTHPQNFVIHKDGNENEYHITIFLNSLDKSDKTTTYIQWNEKDTDTIEATFYRLKNSITTNEVWFNGKLIGKGEVLGDGVYAKLIK